jgi:methyltransferase
VSAALVVVFAVAALRIGEIAYARRNAAALIARGGVEVGSAHYPLFFVLHGGWLLAIFWTVPAETPVNWAWLGVFALLQLGRFWVIASLGPFWTTRVITLPGAPLVRRGPYRFIRHPNYLVVSCEIAVLPLVFGAWRLALVFSLLNAALLVWRIKIEDQALAPRRAAVR